MDQQTIITIMGISLPLLGAGFGYLIKYNIEKKKELTNELTKQRREIYQQYVNLIIDLFSGDKTNKKNTSSDLITKQLYEFYKKYVLFASPNVITAFSNYFQFLYKTNDSQDPKANLELLTRIMLEMRKDLGLKNNSLGKEGEVLFRALIKDYDTIWTKR